MKTNSTATTTAPWLTASQPAGEISRPSGIYLVGGEGDPKQDKKTPNNQTSSRWVEPIRDRKDIDKCKEYLKSVFLKAPDGRRKLSAGRDYLLFVVGVNAGLRVSDLIRLQYSDLIGTPGRASLREKKTGKHRRLYSNSSIKEAMELYLTETGISLNPSDPLFVSTKTRQIITDRTAELMIKRATRKCGVAGNYNTHSLRKTFAYQLYMRLTEKGDPLALPKVQKFLNHRNQSDTLRYLGLQQQMEAEMIEDLNL